MEARMRMAIGVAAGLAIGYLAMYYFRSGHLPF
jgi:hypothetical protein